jgi:hypothetical protein
MRSEVKFSCRTSKEVSGLTEHVKVQAEAVISLGRELSNPERMSEIRATALSRSLSFPIKFEGAESEVSIHLTNFQTFQCH